MSSIQVKYGYLLTSADVFEVSDTLDSSLKKNSGFIRKVRVSLNEASLPSLISEVSTLSLVKYLSEVVSALTEGFTKCKSTAELFVGVEVSSALFQRFGTDFCGPLLSNMLRGIANPSKASLMTLSTEERERESKARLERQRIVIRIIIELWLAGVFRSTSDVMDFDIPSFATARNTGGIIDPPSLSAVKEILSSDLVKFTPVSIGIMVIKTYGDILLGNASFSNLTESTPLVFRDVQLKFRKVFSTYATAMETRVRTMSHKLIQMEQSNESSFLRTGRVKSEIEVSYATLMEEAEEMLSNCEDLFAALDLEMGRISLTSNRTIKDSNDDGKGDWEDDHERQFYENIMSLTRKDGLEEDTKQEDDTDLLEQFESLKKSQPSKDKAPEITQEGEEFRYKEEADDGPASSTDAAETSSNGEKMQEILLVLTRTPSREVVDRCALDFTYVNNRASRRRILNHFIHMKTTEQHKLPFFVRFIATVAPVCPDLVKGILDYLAEYFRFLMRKEWPQLYLTRLYVMRFYSEMVKFGLVPKKVTFHLLHACIMKLNHFTVEMLSHLLEGCGRYLFRKPDTNLLMVKYLEFLKEQKARRYLAVEDRSMLANALYYVNPPPEIVVVEKKRPIIEKYIRKLIYVDLDQESAVHVFGQLMKLDWNDKDTFAALKKVFCKIWKVKQVNIELMAKYVHSLKPYYYSFGVIVVDSVLEDIRVGIEQGGYKNNQKRISQVMYLGELCNNKIVDHTVIMSTLYLILTFGYPNNQPSPLGCPLDPNDELFRIRLACSLLDSCGKFLNYVDAQLPTRGISRELDIFMYFLQYFIQCKSKMSVDVEFQVRDTFKLVRPQMPIYTNLQTASRGLQAIIAGEVPESEASNVLDQGEEEEGDDDIDRDADYIIPKEEVEEEPAWDKARRLQREERNRVKREERENQQAVDDFEQEFQLLMLDRFDAKKSKRTTFDAPIPKIKEAPEVTYVPGRDGTMPKKPNKVQYTLLTKKANKQETRALGLPSESKFVAAVLKEKEERWKMQERIRNIVLRYESENWQEDEPETRIEKIVQPQIPTRKSLWPKQPKEENKEESEDVKKQ